jgi:hypothetical protein
MGAFGTLSGGGGGSGGGLGFPTNPSGWVVLNCDGLKAKAGSVRVSPIVVAIATPCSTVTRPTIVRLLVVDRFIGSPSGAFAAAYA